MEVTAIILAAGESRRMGIPKALLEVAPGVTFLARLVATFTQAGIASLVVVGAHADEILDAHPSLTSIRNVNWEQGQLGSVHLGLRTALGQRAARLLIHPIDAPLIAASTARAVAQALGSFDAVAPTFDGKPGHPLGLTAHGAQQVLASGAGSLAEAVAPFPPLPLAVDDAAILDNLNSPEAYFARLGHPPRSAVTR